jgi:hypothetical protein
MALHEREFFNEQWSMSDAVRVYLIHVRVAGSRCRKLDVPPHPSTVSL